MTARRRVPRGDRPVPPPIEDDGSPSRLRRRRQRDVDVDDPIDESSWWRILHFDPLRPHSTSWRDRRMTSSSASSSSVPAPRVVRHYGADVRFFAPGTFHYSADELEPHRRVGDPEMDGLLEYLMASSAKEGGGGGGCGAFDDVVAQAKDEHARMTSTPACAFYGHYLEGVPTWVEYDAIQRGIDVFLAYLPAAGCALFYRSLVGGFSIPKIARVLVATGYLVPRGRGGGDSRDDDDDVVPRSRSTRTVDRDRRRSEERLVDTGGFLACCFAPHPSSPYDDDGDGVNGSRPTPTSPNVPAASLRPGGRGWEAALRVRVLHAKVRRSLLRREGANAWDVEADGVPINQEDTAATLLAFSVNVLLGIEIAAGRPLRASEQRDYLALWRYIGWLLGVDTPEGAGRSSNPGGEGGRLIPIDPCGPRRPRDDDDDDDDDDRYYDGGSSERDPTDAEDDVDPDDDPIVHSYATLESVILHLLHPDRSSRELVNHMLGLGRSVVFRSEVCRKFLGDPLSDELGMPKSRANWEGWRWESLSDLASHARVKFLLYVFLVFLRCYTLLTMTCPWFRRRAIVWHGMLERRFLRLWEKSHDGRVTEAALKQKGETSKSTTRTSYCPFAMIMDPNSGCVREKELCK